jgi:Kef-type K+ transport system membrane component KefB/nucleotide-binding universal stress UspA family protein
MHLSTVVLVLVEVLLVISLSRLVGFGFRWIHQPLVIGEIVAGIMLGPSLFGLIAPDLAAAVFPGEAVPFLEVLSNVGLIFFMFLIGLELDPKYLKGQLEIAVLTSHVSILLPFALGTVLSLLLYPLLSNADVSFTAFTLFLGAAMSITAFPVLARIITEHNLQGTKLGTLALTCAAVDDVTAWCLLALAIAVTRTNSMTGALPTVLLSAAYVALMVTVGKKLLKQLVGSYERAGRRLTQSLLATIYVGVLISALITELIGIHLIFGAFLLGTVMPKQDSELTHELAVKTEDFVLTVLLPIFFAYSGLRTQIGLLNTPRLWLLCAAVVGVAIAGKYIGTYVAARVGGIGNREASALGWLMNTRGLTELVILNIGLSLNVISPLLFTMLVIMALVTTFMTAPLLEWTYPKRLIKLDQVEQTSTEPDYKVFVPIANPNTQKGLVQLAAAIAFDGAKPSTEQSAAVYPLSLIELRENDYAFESLPAEVERQINKRRARLEELAQSLEPPEIRDLIHPIVQISNDVGRDTAQIAEADDADLILVGWHRSTFRSNRLGGRVGQILSMAPVDIAVFVDKERDFPMSEAYDWQSLLVPYAGTDHDDLGIELALRLLLHHDKRHLTILRAPQSSQAPTELSYELRTVLDQLPDTASDRIKLPVVEAGNTMQAVIEASAAADLTIAGASREWGLERQTLGRYTDALARNCQSSLLIARKYSKVASHMASALGKQDSASQPQ